MPPSPVNDTKRKLLDQLKRTDAARVADLADRLDISSNAVRQHLDDLEATGLVVRNEAQPAGGRGRPSSTWTLTELASELFPDRHSDLTVELITAIRDSVGDDGLDRIVHQRSRRQLEAYRLVVGGPGDGSLLQRAEALAEQRTAEGYLAEAAELDDGTVTLVEHHCPVCDAASVCQGLCREELDVFAAVLGDDVEVERTTHVLSGDHRCTYEIRRVR